ncbi:hypothetical protein HanRHA438_Chr06g0247651 [Helianthus annuus]|nr:hypothetical protein HanIR_Chr06g0256231 [Helianthus annuus]KAJ0910005.1 hypothetical protein HanRHA438_Chr06g0247651 [Helianthus annuus]
MVLARLHVLHPPLVTMSSNRISCWHYSLVRFWGWDKAYDYRVMGSIPTRGFLQDLLSFLLNWCIGILPSGDEYDRVVSSGLSVIQICSSKNNFFEQTFPDDWHYNKHRWEQHELTTQDRHEVGCYRWCLSCNMTLDTPKEFEEHEVTVHGSWLPGFWKCMCKSSFDDLGSLIR